MRIPLQLVVPVAVITAASAYAAESGQPAAPDPPTATKVEPPASAGRIALVSGNVAIYQLGQTDWTRAEVGLPVATGVWLATDPKARAEIQLGSASADIASGTQLSFADLQQRTTEIAVSRGRIDVHLQQQPEGGSFRIDLPIGGVQLVEAGSYDITAGSEGRPSRVAVFAGSARVTAGGLDQTVTAGNALVLKAAGENRSASVESAKPDEFVRWSRSREGRQQAAATDQSPAVTPPADGSTEAEEPAPRAHATRHARVERHRRHRHHHYARVFHHRRYGYAVAAPVLPNPLSIIGSLLPFR